MYHVHVSICAYVKVKQNIKRFFRKDVTSLFYATSYI